MFVCLIGKHHPHRYTNFYDRMTHHTFMFGDIILRSYEIFPIYFQLNSKVNFCWPWFWILAIGLKMFYGFISYSTKEDWEILTRFTKFGAVCQSNMSKVGSWTWKISSSWFSSQLFPIIKCDIIIIITSFSNYLNVIIELNYLKLFILLPIKYIYQ